MKNIASENVIVTLSVIGKIVLLTHTPHLLNTLKVQLAHPLLGTSHSKSVSGVALESSTPNKKKPADMDKNPAYGWGRFLMTMEITSTLPNRS